MIGKNVDMISYSNVYLYGVMSKHKKEWQLANGNGTNDGVYYSKMISSVIIFFFK